MLKPNLPIQNISDSDFNSGFKVKHLDGRILKDEDLKAIEKAFGLDDRSANSRVGGISCDEAHGHSYRCHYYRSPEAGVVDRLIIEIRRYQDGLSKIQGIMEERK